MSKISWYPYRSNILNGKTTNGHLISMDKHNMILLQITINNSGLLVLSLKRDRFFNINVFDIGTLKHIHGVTGVCCIDTMSGRFRYPSYYILGDFEPAGSYSPQAQNDGVNDGVRARW